MTNDEKRKYIIATYKEIHAAVGASPNRNVNIPDDQLDFYFNHVGKLKEKIIGNGHNANNTFKKLPKRRSKKNP